MTAVKVFYLSLPDCLHMVIQVACRACFDCADAGVADMFFSLHADFLLDLLET